MAKRMTGDEKSFTKNWQTREESYYNHWVKGQPQNQIQFAFRNHWEVFSLLMKDPFFNGGKRSLEVGCGRGSISGYFSDAGFDCTLLDLSPEVIEIAKKIFAKNKLKAKFTVGDVTKMPYPDGSFDVITSIGLLEHFENIEAPIREQIRVLSKGGLFTAYVVPKYSRNIQKDYN